MKIGNSSDICIIENNDKFDSKKYINNKFDYTKSLSRFAIQKKEKMITLYCVFSHLIADYISLNVFKNKF